MPKSTKQTSDESAEAHEASAAWAQADPLGEPEDFYESEQPPGHDRHERLGHALSELIENPLVTGAIGRALGAREKAAQAQELWMGALNLPSAADIERLTRRVRSVSQRLEGVEDSMQRIGRSLVQASGMEGQLNAIEQRLEGIEQRLGAIDSHVEGLDPRLKQLGADIDALRKAAQSRPSAAQAAKPRARAAGRSAKP